MFKRKISPILIATYCLNVAADDRTELDSLFALSLKQLSEITVVTAASGFEQKVSRAPATVTVITAEEWQAKGARLLSDVLIAVPGFHVGKPPVSFKHNKFVIRGLSGPQSSQIKIMIDGEPFEYMQDSGTFIGFRLPLTSFQRIEVIKGPGSAIYGADAYAGIVNLVSYKQGEIPASIGARTGSFSTNDIFARGQLKLGESQLQWSIDYTHSDDDNDKIVSSDLQSTFDGIFGSNASKAPGPIDEHYEVFSLLAKWRMKNWTADFFTWRNFDVGLGAGVAQALDSNGSASAKFDHIKLQYDLSDYFGGKTSATLSLKEQKGPSYLAVFPPGATLPIGLDGNIDFSSTNLTLFEDGFIGTPSPEGNTTTFRLTQLLNTSENNFLRWEIGYEALQFKARERKNFGTGILDGSESIVTVDSLTDVTGTDFVYLPEKSRSFYYFSIQDEWQINPELSLNLGLRYDEYSDFGSTTNPRFGLIWQATEKFAFKFFAGTAFKSPSITDLDIRNNPVVVSGKELQPETIATLEAGLNFQYLFNKNLTFSMSFFDYHAKDLIETVFDEQIQGNVVQNIGEQKGKGGELWLKWKPLTNITFDFNYSHLSAEDKKQFDVPDIPNRMAYASMNWRINDDWSWFIDNKWIKDRSRATGDSRPGIKDYNWANSRLVRNNLLQDLSVALIVKNLFEQDAYEPSTGAIADDYPLQSRQWYLELIYNFN